MKSMMPVPMEIFEYGDLGRVSELLEIVWVSWTPYERQRAT